MTDGSNAAPGQVGEFIDMQVNIPYAAYPADTVTNVSTLIVQPGDWDLFAFTVFSTQVGFVNLNLSPVPTGFGPGALGGASFPGPMTSGQQLVLIHSPGRGNFTVPTLLAFAVTINQGTASGLPAGTAVLFAGGRRRR